MNHYLTNVDQDLWRHMAWLGHNELIILNDQMTKVNQLAQQLHTLETKSVITGRLDILINYIT